MKFITIPEDVEIKDPDQGNVVKTLNFVEWIVKNVLNNHSIVGKTGESLLMAVDLKMMFNDKQPGDVVGLSDEEYDLLWRSVNQPPNPYFPQVMEQAISFIRTVKNVSEKDPREE